MTSWGGGDFSKEIYGEEIASRKVIKRMYGKTENVWPRKKYLHRNYSSSTPPSGDQMDRPLRFVFNMLSTKIKVNM